ncbi:MAG: hypothetical protein E6Q97_15665 [Desulfurellales bacterium]|nr:MAG: hypothetical protein E6Q97_15665 [Desulfurellales bacterium]
MTAFIKRNFNTDCGYVTYHVPGEERPRFVARFKYGKGGMAGWISHMIKHISVEDYFAAYDAGNAPLTIMEAYGYMSPNMKRAIKDGRFTMEEYLRSQRPLKTKETLAA